MKNPNTTAILGALVADSAALGLHWLYDPARIAEIEAARGLVFLHPDADNYAGSKGYFAHGGKSPGDSTSYGETCLLMLKHLAKHGKFNRVGYQTEYRAHFGPGGAFVGYIDSPTRQTLRTLLSTEPPEFPAASGADDDQLPALAVLPALVAAHIGTLDGLLGQIEEAVRVTNNNELAVAAARCSAAALFEVLQGTPIGQALANALPFAGDTLTPLLEEVLALPTLDCVAVAQHFGMSCHVAEGLPVIFHIAQHASSYRDAVESNIRAGGDSCGRSIVLGALVAAHAATQNSSGSPIPLSWLARYGKFAAAADAFAAL
ncbi:ADP-ribosylglycohydrolase family protein [Nitrosospira sp. Nsp13]|uniref:ADP-ribosylglycohydrolase family protein n=1 Tax=Nitrosospira sp. Nsp13 TaxID=1855332 RepID=UPI00088D71F5|nr:ADP-ribosylglycohydrolase family protein [Nitrosospira sp. Nsp13]SCY05607.1 ADP-ribosylglycohydrolase [Nitrosospira sp. Nsp13]